MGSTSRYPIPSCDEVLSPSWQPFLSISRFVWPSSVLLCERTSQPLPNRRLQNFTLHAIGSSQRIEAFTGSPKAKKMQPFTPALAIFLLLRWHHFCLAFNHDDIQSTVVYTPDKLLVALTTGCQRTTGGVYLSSLKCPSEPSFIEEMTF